MAEPGLRAEDAALWRRWQALAPEMAPGTAVAPEPLLLAAYAEGRLGEAEAAAVERWLAAAPEALADLAAARAVGNAVAEAAAETMIVRAQALVPAAGPKVVPLRRPQPQLGRWRMAMAWGGLAASILATSLVGFTLGNDTYASLMTSTATTDSAYGDLLDTPSGLFTTFSEDTGT
jgi:anti-sigma factor RsiW